MFVFAVSVVLCLGTEVRRRAILLRDSDELLKNYYGFVKLRHVNTFLTTGAGYVPAICVTHEADFCVIILFVLLLLFLQGRMRRLQLHWSICLTYLPIAVQVRITCKNTSR